MTKKLALMVILVVFFALASSCGSSIDSNLVGTWEEVDTYDILIFTGDGEMGRGDSVEEINLNYEYTASNGTGKYWLPAHSDEKVRFEYSIRGEELDFNVPGGYAGLFTRVE